MSDYPTDRQHRSRSGKGIWALQVIRALQKTGAANHIGRDAAWLISTIATMEDVKHYTGAVGFWNGHLMDATGFGSKQSFLNARSRAVKAGWLVYFEGRKGVSAKYWTTIPDAAVPFIDATILEEDAGPNPDHKPDRQTKCRSESGPQTGPQTGPESGPHSTLPHSHTPEEEGAALPASSAAKKSKKPTAPRAAYPKHFEAVWNAYPATRRKNKGQTFDAYQDAVKRVADADSGDMPKAAAWILEKVMEFAGSYSGKQFAPEPQRWFRDDRFHDSPEAWAKFEDRANGSSKRSEFSTVRDIIKRIWSPDLKNYREVETAICNAELFAAAKFTKLSVIADASDHDKDIQRTFDQHLESIRSPVRATA